MKNIFPLLALLATFFWTACETDFELEGEWRDIPILYGALSVQDTAYYVRLEKAFLEPGGNAEQIAQNADSIYYPPGAVTLTLERLSGGQSVVMERVDGNAEGYARQDGPFATTPNILYKAALGDLELQGGDDFRLQVKRGEEVLASVESTMIRPLENDYFSMDLNTANYNRRTEVRYRPGGTDASIFDVTMFFNYLETDPDNPTTRIPKTLTWEVAKGVERIEGISVQEYEIENEAFYRFLGGALEPLSTGTRRFENIVFQVTAVGSEVEEYLNIAGANIGITSSQNIPVYTNVDGGFGIVTSRYILTSPVFNLNVPSRGSLYNSQYTKELNFVP